MSGGCCGGVCWRNRAWYAKTLESVIVLTISYGVLNPDQAGTMKEGPFLHTAW